MGASGRGQRLRPFRIATRGSPLALAQSRSVAARLDKRCPGPSAEMVVVRTSGDMAVDVPVERLGGQGAFVKEVQAAVLDGRADLTVHSAKDLPSQTPPGLVLACVPERLDPRDALIGGRLSELAPGSPVATGSVRRRAQLSWLRPDLTFTELRGNMGTRIDRARAVGAGVVALAALVRLGLEHEVSQVLDTIDMLPQVGQGALAVECRQDDTELGDLLIELDDVEAHRALSAERAFLGELGSGCTMPVAALAVPDGEEGTLRMEAMLATADGRVLLRATRHGSDPEDLGAGLARQLLDGAGGRQFEEWHR